MKSKTFEKTVRFCRTYPMGTAGIIVGVGMLTYGITRVMSGEFSAALPLSIVPLISGINYGREEHRRYNDIKN